MTEPAIEVHDNPAARRFEVHADDAVAFASYELDGDTIVFTHTIVPVDLEGRGVGSALVRAGLAAARERGLEVVPQCSFVAAYMRRHPDMQDLLASGHQLG